MKIALDPALIPNAPLATALTFPGEHGYDGVELGNRADGIPAYEPLSLTFDSFRAARREAEASGTQILSVAVIQDWSDPDESRRAQAVDWWLGGLRAAVELGCPRVNTELSGAPNRPAECRTSLLRSLEQILPVAEREGVVIDVEPHPWDFLETTASALDLLDEVGSPHLRYLHCLPHSYHLGGSITDQVRLAAGRFDHLHLADTFRPERTILNPPDLDVRVHQHFDIGDGELDWSEAAQALRDVGFDGLATVQVYFWPERSATSARANLDAVATLLRGATDDPTDAAGSAA